MPMSSSDASPLADTEVHFFRSEHVGDEFKIVVGHCGSSASVSPVPLVIGDTWMHFGIAVEVVRLLRLTEVVPPLLVVGVGYRTTDLGETSGFGIATSRRPLLAPATAPMQPCWAGPIAFSRSSPTN